MELLLIKVNNKIIQFQIRIGIFQLIKELPVKKIITFLNSKMLTITIQVRNQIILVIQNHLNKVIY